MMLGISNRLRRQSRAWLWRPALLAATLAAPAADPNSTSSPGPTAVGPATTSTNAALAADAGSPPKPHFLTSLASAPTRPDGFRIIARPDGWSAGSAQKSALFGWCVAATDANQDGWPDLFVGARSFDGLEKDCGGVFQFVGSPTGLQAAALPPLWVPHEDCLFGGALASAGDVNGDRYPDLVIGTPRFRAPGHEGAAFLYRGGEMPLQQTNANGVIWGARPAASMGFSVAGAGDVNGDGLQDVIAGAPRYRHHFKGEGGVALYLGSSNGLSATYAWVAYGTVPEATFGYAVSGVGDVNGDGFDDVLVGAPQFSAPHYHGGRVFLFLGPPRQLVNEPSWVADGPEARIRFGSSLCALGDVNGDGFSDFAVGAPGNEQRLNWPGKVYVYFGSRNGLSNASPQVLVGPHRGSQFGRSIALAGDVNGDGFADLLVGAPWHQIAHPAEGQVSLFLGHQRGFPSFPSWVLNSRQENDRLGWSLAGGIDFNRDGLADFVIGSPYYDTGREGGGRVDVYFGSRTNYESTPAPLIMQTVGEKSPVQTPVSVRWLPASLALGLVCLGLIAVVSRRHQVRQAAAAAQEERERLARDLHDGLGADLARLALSQSATAPDDSDAAASKPSAAHAVEALQALHEVVWSVHPRHDTLESLVTFLGQHAERFFANTSIRCFCDLPVVLPAQPVTVDVRKNVFLVVKEALANVLKHSGATEVWLRVAWTAPELTVTIEDNGHGLSAASSLKPTLPSGQNGLANMHRRMAELGGSFTFENRSDGGARARLIAPLGHKH